MEQKKGKVKPLCKILPRKNNETFSRATKNSKKFFTLAKKTNKQNQKKKAIQVSCKIERKMC